MADWTDVDPNTLLPGEPWTSAKALAAFENVVAMAQRATGAPKVLGSDYDLISRTVISGSPSAIDFVFDPVPYDAILFRLGNVLPANNATLRLRTSSDGGVNYDAGTNDYRISGGFASITTDTIASGGTGLSGDVVLYNPSALLRTYISALTLGGDITGFSSLRGEVRTANVSVNAVRFFWGIGNFANQGVISCYGMRNL